MAKTRKKARAKAGKRAPGKGSSPRSSAAREAHGHGEHSHEAQYIKIWKILIVLLVISVVGPMFEIQALTLITAFGIAGVKAYLVVTRFMHLDLENRFIAYFIGTSVAFMFLFYAGTSPDVMNHVGRNWSNVAAKAETKRALEQIEKDRAQSGGNH
jgi:caa(3)-type oxidase subunit IV